MTLILPRLRRDEALLEKSGGANIQLQRYWQRVVEAAEAQDANITMIMRQILAPFSTRTLDADATLTTADYLILGDATAAAITLTLPAASLSNGAYIITKKIDASANHVIVAAAGADTIDGAATVEIKHQYDVATVACDGSAWWIV